MAITAKRGQALLGVNSNSNNLFHISNYRRDYNMILLSKLIFGDSDFNNENYFRDEGFEVMDYINGEKVTMIFDVEIIQNLITEETGIFVDTEMIYTEFIDGYYWDSGEDYIPQLKEQLEEELKELIKSEI